MRCFVRADRPVAGSDVRVASESLVAEPSRDPRGGNRSTAIGKDRTESARRTDAFARRNRLEGRRRQSVAARGGHARRLVLHDHVQSRNARSYGTDRDRLQRKNRPRWSSVVSRVRESAKPNLPCASAAENRRVARGVQGTARRKLAAEHEESPEAIDHDQPTTRRGRDRAAWVNRGDRKGGGRRRSPARKGTPRRGSAAIRSPPPPGAIGAVHFPLLRRDPGDQLSRRTGSSSGGRQPKDVRRQQHSARREGASN